MNTPRTDALLNCPGNDPYETGWIEHARRLETELAEVAKELAALKKDYDVVKPAWRKASEERDELKATLSDPVAVRVNLLRGTIAKPADLHFEHDEHGLIAGLKAKLEKCRTAMIETLAECASLPNFVVKKLSEALDQTK